MTKGLTIIGILLLIGLGLSAQTEMNIDRCIDYALKNNPSLKSAKLDEDNARAEINAVMGIGLPQINASAGMNYNFAIPSQFLPDFISPAVYGVLFGEQLLEERDLGAPQVFAAQFGVDYTAQAGLSASQMIFNGSYFVGLEASRVYSDLIKEQTQQTEADVKANVKKAAFAVMVNTERLSLLDASIRQIDKLIAETEALYDNGFVEKTDIDRLKVNRNNLRVEKQTAQNLIDIAMMGLKFQMGMPLDDQLIITDSLVETRVDPASLRKVKVEYENLPEYRVLKVQEKLSLLDLRNKRVQRIPVINAIASYGANAGATTFGDAFDFENNWFENGLVGVSLQWNILDGFTRKNRIEQAKIQNQKVQIGINQLQQSIDLQVNQAARNLSTSYEAVQVQKENVELAEEVLRVSTIKYREGVGSNLEVSTAETELETAQTNYYAALYQLLVAKVDYERASGQL